MSDISPFDLAVDDAERETLRMLAHALAATPALPELTPDLRDRTLAAVFASPAPAAQPEPAPEPAAAAEEGRPRRSRATRPDGRSRRRAWLQFGAVGSLTAAAAVAVVLLVTGGGSGPDGKLELRAELRGPGGDATVEVRALGIGRAVAFDSGSLPILPRGEYYEVWFVGPGDSAARPNRVSAGTFHPDPDGRSHVTLKAAADPARLPVIEVTSEPGDGDPRASGTVVLRTPAR